MEFEIVLRWLHVLGACVLIGTGAGIAFFMVMAHQTRNPVVIAHVAGIVVLADFVFTASAVIVQPVTGILLAQAIGWPLTEGWILLSFGLYLFIGAFWLPVVVIQVRLRGLARTAAADGTALPREYFRLYRIWFACGFPAFAAILVLLWTMIARPALFLY